MTTVKSSFARHRQPKVADVSTNEVCWWPTDGPNRAGTREKRRLKAPLDRTTIRRRKLHPMLPIRITSAIRVGGYAYPEASNDDQVTAYRQAANFPPQLNFLSGESSRTVQLQHGRPEFHHNNCSSPSNRPATTTAEYQATGELSGPHRISAATVRGRIRRRTANWVSDPIWNRRATV